MDTKQSDTIFPITRIVAAGVILVLLLAFVALYIEPDHTDIDFAWTILPRTSAILIGAGYMAGAYFFARLVMERRWHRVQRGFLPITAFTIFMLAATVLHWSRFHHGTLDFYLWTGIYVVTPFLVPFVWLHNQATESRDLEPGDLRSSPPARWAMGVIGVVGILAFVVGFVQPAILIALTPWKLTELTARIFAGWSILTFSTVLSIAADGRWSATRILMQSAMVGIVLVLLGLPRIWGDLNPRNPLTYVFVGGLLVALVAFVSVHVWLDRSVRNPDRGWRAKDPARYHRDTV